MSGPDPWEAYARDLAAVVARRAALDREIFVTVSAARAAGVPWSRIGDALGISRQAAWERYGSK